MLMHKPLERFYNYLAKIIDRKAAKMDAEAERRKKMWAEIYPEGVPSSADKLEVKNPCRYM